MKDQMNDLYGKIKVLWEEFDSNHTKHVASENKAAGQRARKSLGEIKKLVTDYRKISVDFDKAE